MPDLDPAQGLLNALEGDSPELTESVEQEPTVKLSPYAENYLKSVSPEHVPIVTEHVKRWDAGFTQHTQKLHNDYKQQLGQWSGLGDYDTVSQYVQLAQQLVADPSAFVDRLEAEGFITSRQAAQMQQQVEDDLSGLPPAVAEKLKRLDALEGNFSKVEKALGGVAQHLTAQQAAAKQVQEDRELENYLGQLKARHGDFDEQAVLRFMAAGMDGDAAVGYYNSLIQNGLNSRSAPKPPNVLSGASPSMTPDPSKLSDAERKAALLASLG